MARPRRSLREQPAGWWGFAGITALVIADVVLVALALSATRTHAPSSAARVAPPLSIPTLSPAPEPEPEPEPAAAPANVAPLSVVLGAVDDTVAYRAVTGACPDVAAQVEVTVDAGATWTPVVPADARSIQSIAASSADDVTIVAADPASCAPSAQRSFVQGADWAAADDLGSRWHLDGSAVVAPGGAASTPCATSIQVAARSATEAAVLCDDATVSATADAGATWSGPTAVPAAASVTSGADGYSVAVVDGDGCDGVQVVSLSTDLQTGAPGACVASDAGPGATVVSAAGGVLWLWSGDVLGRSSDGGATW